MTIKLPKKFLEIKFINTIWISQTIALLQTVNSTQFFRTMYYVYEAKFQEPCTMFCFINIVHGAEKTVYYLLFAIELRYHGQGRPKFRS